MDNTDYCSYEIAKKLYELGFDLDCEMAYFDRPWNHELEPYNPSDSDLTISLAKLREVLNGMADCDGFVVETPDTIINRIKQELK